MNGKELLSVDVAHVLVDRVLDVGGLAVADEAVLGFLEQHECKHTKDLDYQLVKYIWAQVWVTISFNPFLSAPISQILVIRIRITFFRLDELIVQPDVCKQSICKH